MIITKNELWNQIPGNYSETPCITSYEPDNKTSDGAVVIFPGGAYMKRAEHEGDGYARFLCEHGITAFVVDYRVTPSFFPLPLLDARRAVQYVRYFSERFNISKDKIYVMGSSAGGHLASMLCNVYDEFEYENKDEISREDFVPDGHILCYPVINLDDEKIANKLSGINLLGDKADMYKTALSNEKRVNERTPKAFIWHTTDDLSVNILNSINYAYALKENNVDFELHIYPNGRHGLGLGIDDSKESDHISSWGDLLIKWLKYNDF